MNPITPPAWSARAACARTDIDPEAFFPGNGRALTPETLKALALCDQCHVRAKCGQYARRTSAQGIWAGKVRVPTNDWRPTYDGDPRFVRASTKRRVA